MKLSSVFKIINDFNNENSKKTSLGEVECFKSLLKALKNNSSTICKEYHACAYVEFNRRYSVGKKNIGKCEIADLYILVFSSSKKHLPKHTFLQAKFEKKDLEKIYLPIGNNNFKINFTQWDLLNNRPTIAPIGKMKNMLPINVLKSASYKSIGSFGFFIKDKNGANNIEFIFSSAAIVEPVKMPVSAKDGNAFININKKKCFEFDAQNRDELIFAFGLLKFLFALGSGIIGSPIQSQDEKEFCSKVISNLILDEESGRKRDILFSLANQLELNTTQNRFQSVIDVLVIDTDEQPD